MELVLAEVSRRRSRSTLLPTCFWSSVAVTIIALGATALAWQSSLIGQQQLVSEVVALREVAKMSGPIAASDWVEVRSGKDGRGPWAVIVRADGSIVAGSLPSSVPQIKTGNPDQIATTLAATAKPRLIVEVIDLPPVFTGVVAARDTSPGLLHWLVVGAGSVALLVFGGAWLAQVSYAHQRYRERVLEIADVLRRTRAGESGLRPAPAGPRSDDEIDEIAQLLSEMLDQIEDNIRHVQSWTAHAAHELRNKLARLPSARSSDLDERAALDDTLDMLNALMDLAQTGSSVDRAPAPVDMEYLLGGIASLYADAAEDKGIKIVVTADRVPLFAEGSLLNRAVANLVDNALRYAPAGTEVQLGYAAAPSPTITVRDFGPGPQGDTVAQLIAAPKRPEDKYGKRIGMRIVEAIVLRHGGRLHIEDATPGMRVVITLGMSRSLSA